MLLRASTPEATRRIAGAIAGVCRSGDLLVLAGDIGAGKTVFAQGFGAALGISEVITSPTFTLVHSYPVPNSRLTLHHADLYRLDSTADVDDLALHELAEFDGMVLIEWGDIPGADWGDHLEVRLVPDDPPVAGAETSDDFGLGVARTIELSGIGRSWAGRWDRLAAALEEHRC